MSKMISYCGIDCSKCESYLATQADSDIDRKKIALKCRLQFNVDLEPEQINCTGCKSDGVKCAFATTLCEIRKCNIRKSQPYCAVCREYKCAKLEKIIASAPAIGEALTALRTSSQNQNTSASRILRDCDSKIDPE
jgi:hypothetical protein